MSEANVISLRDFGIGQGIHSAASATGAGNDTPKGRDGFLFFRSWLAHPLRVAALAPSSSALGEVITSELSSASGAVLELGPGTGVFTKALLTRGVDEGDLTLVELDPAFADLIEMRFPKAKVLRGNAARLQFPPRSFGAVVSGLPLLSMSPRRIMAILKAAFSGARTNAAFYQFTYGPVCPVPKRILDRLGLKAVRIGGTVWNLPPASVYRITRRRPLQQAI